MESGHILSLVESKGIARVNEFFQIGIPLPQGEYFDTDAFQLQASGKYVPSERQATAYWSDLSLKWCVVRFYISLQKNQAQQIFLVPSKGGTQKQAPQKLITEQGNLVQLKADNFNISLHKDRLTLFHNVSDENKIIAENGFCRLIDSNHQVLENTIKDFEYRTAYSETGALYCEVKMAGQFNASNTQNVLNFEATVVFYLQSKRVKYTITLHNPSRAVHPSGLWDLGDLNSVYIDDFTFGFDVAEGSQIQWKTGNDRSWEELEHKNLRIYQESSGGDNWNSPNHKNKDNRVPMQHKGFICEHGQLTEKGLRATPQISAASEAGAITASMDKFWQNFPKSMEVHDRRIELGLFPGCYPDSIELQPGEKKTHNFYLDFNNVSTERYMDHGSILRSINTEWMKRCRVIPHLFNNPQEDPVLEIIQQGLTGENNFFAKREKIDEYGWRNFGDLFADHETDLYQGNDIFISHYNNQYDPLYGFLKQYLLSGNNQWLELADDLARHITDIDLYHTDEDKVEYNGGPFWHTDHYLEAKTSSHRGFSRQHHYVYEGHAGGGGPAGEHCYTTGLLYHYLVTGCETSRQAVLQLSDWVTCYYEGANTFFDFLIGLKNVRERGMKNILTGRYSLDRGTGYYVNAILDKYYLTNDPAVLEQAEHIIKNTVHPSDDLEERDLGDVEIRWFYTIFFQYVCRYLHMKQENEQLDDSFYYARDTLLHYADWMVENEQPYLEKPEILEFPNHTWTAQDIRKVNLMFFAARYASGQPQKYMDKANQWMQYIIAHLADEPTRTYTRILAILMQNYIPSSAFIERVEENELGPVRQYPALDVHSKSRAMKQLFSSLVSVIRHFSIRKEFQWLNTRTNLFSGKQAKSDGR